MHPINKNNFGVKGIVVSYYNGTSVVNGYIVKQIGPSKFKVTDGTHPKTVTLAPTTAIANALAANPTRCTILTYPANAGATGATFTTHYAFDGATVATQNSSNWNVGDLLPAASGGGILAVATVSAGSIATLSVNAAGSYTALLSAPSTFTRAAGTGATFVAHYGVDTVTVTAGGTAYGVGNVLTLASSGGATLTVSAVTGGVITAVTVTTIGTVTALLSNPVAVTGGAGTGATFTLKYKLLPGTTGVTSSGGTGYNVGDTLTFVGLVATTSPTASITTATSHAATAVTVATAGTGITTAATSITSSVTTAALAPTYTVTGVTVSGGSGYALNETLDFNGLTGATRPVAHISGFSSGTIPNAVAVTTAGAGITAAATSLSVNGPTQHVSHIYDNRVITTEGNFYGWTTNQTVDGTAIIATYT